MTAPSIIGWVLFALMTGVAYYCYQQWKNSVYLTGMMEKQAYYWQVLAEKLMSRSELMLEPEDKNWRNN